MSKIVQKQIWWDPVDAADLAGYRVYTALAGNAFSYNLPFIETDAPDVNAPEDFPADTFATEADYSIWVTALDIGGNESDPLALSGRFDFIPPPAPVNGGIRDL